MNSKLPKALSEKQEKMRQQTINRVLHALSDLQAQGCRINIKNLMEYTSLSRSVFSKPHVRALLLDYGFTSLQPKIDSTQTQKSLTKEQRLRAEIRKKDERIKQLLDENSALKWECELLRGKLFLMMQKQDLE